MSTERSIIEFRLSIDAFNPNELVTLNVSALPADKNKYGHIWIIEDKRYPQSNDDDTDDNYAYGVMGAVSNDDMIAFCRSLLACCESFEKVDEKLNN